MKQLKISLLLAFITFVIVSCKKSDSGTGNSYPKQVSITYKVTSTTINSAALIQYKNESGGNTDVPNPALPYSKTITRTVNKNDVLSLAYGTHTDQTVKLEIIVDNNTVKSQEFPSTAGAIIYTFQ
jgi:uncharacterized protein (UPF0333 family)